VLFTLRNHALCGFSEFKVWVFIVEFLLDFKLVLLGFAQVSDYGLGVKIYVC
jgi:hypothetical protein